MPDPAIEWARAVGLNGQLLWLATAEGLPDGQDRVAIARVADRAKGPAQLDAERCPVDEAGLDDTERAARVTDRDDGLVLEGVPGDRREGGADGLGPGAEEPLDEVDRVAPQVGQGAADGGLRVEEPLGQPARSAAIETAPSCDSRTRP